MRQKKTVHRYLWDDVDHMFRDYDTLKREKTSIDSVTCLWVLWSGMATTSAGTIL